MTPLLHRPLFLGLALATLVLPAWADESFESEVEALAALEARIYVLDEHHQSLRNRYTDEHPETQRVGGELAGLRTAARAAAQPLPPPARAEAARRARGIVVILIEERIGELDEGIRALRRRYADDHPQLRNLLTRRELARIEIARLRQKGVSDLPPRPAGTPAPGAETSDAEELDRMEAELRRLRMRYTDRHPRVRDLKERIEQARQAGDGRPVDADGVADPRVTHLEAAEQHLREAGFAAAAQWVRRGLRELQATGASPLLARGTPPVEDSRGGGSPAPRPEQGSAEDRD